jgi:cell pole-organizing protein PopZ
MGDDKDVHKEQTVEEILAAIRKIISEEEEMLEPVSGRDHQQQPTDFDDILDLSDPLPDEEDGQEKTQSIDDLESKNPSNKEGQEEKKDIFNRGVREGLMSSDTAAISAAALAALGNRDLANEMKVGGNNSLEDLVRDLLKPMLKQWLDANLPNMVETLVREEIKRIRSQNGQ